MDTSRTHGHRHIYVAEAEMTASGFSRATFLRGVSGTDHASAESQPLGNPGERQTMELATTLVKAANGLSGMLGFRYDMIAVQVEAEQVGATSAFTSLRYRLEIATSESPQRAELLHHSLRTYQPAFAMIPPSCRVSAELVVRQMAA
jgi:hypothetical protein